MGRAVSCSTIYGGLINRQQLNEYARFGAQSRLAAIEAEREELLASFPELRGGSPQDDGAAVPHQKRRGMSPSERKAVGTRMPPTGPAAGR